MSDGEELSLARVIDLCRQRDLRLAYEIGAFVVFEACEAVQGTPCLLRASDVWVSAHGETRVAPGPAAESPAAAAALAELLAAVLVVAGQEVPAMLLRLVDREHAEALTLSGYRDELEAALVPLNRSAARRVLSRQLRELQKPHRGVRDGAAGDALPSAASDADADVDALLGYSPPHTDVAAGPNPAEESAQPPRPGDGAAAAGETLETATSSRPPGESESAGDDVGEPGAPEAEAVGGAPRAPDTSALVERGERGSLKAQLGLALVVALAVAAGLYLWFQGPS